MDELHPDVQTATASIPAFLEELESWVSIDSGSYDKDGIDRLGALVRKRMERAGFQVTVYPQVEYGDHLLGIHTGQGRGHLLLLGHIDTVYPTGDVTRRPFRIADGRAYGPGIFDMKSGVLAFLTALELVGNPVLDSFERISIIVNSDEEIGSPSSTPLVREVAAAADAVLVFEPVRAPQSVVVARKGIAAYTLDVQGRSAHAGVMPDAGRNAILELAHLIVALQALHGSIPSVSINVGAVSGGGRRNVVPENAQALFEMRAANQQTFTAAKAAIQQIIDGNRHVPDTNVILTIGPIHQPLEALPASEPLIAIARQSGKTLGLELDMLHIGGASDGNTTGGMGIPTLDGLGLIGQNSHHPNEHIILAEIPRRLALICGIIRSLSHSIDYF
jgi:glutamate carboxypeptidase